MKNIHRQLLEHIRAEEDIVLATVVRTAGSTPQKAGSSALFGENGLIAGTVGGGELEGTVGKIAHHALISGVSKKYYFDLDSDQGEDGAICGGAAEVLVDANPAASRKALEAMENSLSNRLEGNIVTLVSKIEGEGNSIVRFWISKGEHPEKSWPIQAHIRKALAAQLAEHSGKSFLDIDFTKESPGENQQLYIESIKPLPHLVIAGAGHVGRALAHIASLLDFEITIVDDRKEFACRENIPDADHFIVEDIGSAMKTLAKVPDTYIVIVTRGHNNDAEALKPCIGSAASYVGMIGSKNKVAIMKKQFIDSTWATEEQWSEIHTPIGISIGSKTVQEIAISIAAQLISERAKIRNNDA